MTVSSTGTQPELSAPPIAARKEPAWAIVRWALRERALWLGAGAFLAALLGTALLAWAEPVRTLGWLLLIGAGVLAVAAWGRQQWTSAFAPGVTLTSRDGPGISLKPGRARAVRLAGIAISGLLLLGANASYLASPNETFGLAGWLWLATIVLLLASTFRWPETAPGARQTIPVRIAGVAAPPAWTAWELAVFVGIVITAFATRLWDLADFPYTIHPDEILEGRNALIEYINGPGPSVFSTVWDGIDLPALWFIGITASLKIGGLTMVALRLPAALLSMLVVLPVYGLLRGVWGRAAAIAGASILAFSASNVHYSRVTASNSVTAFFWALCFFFVLRGLRLRRPADWALAGLAAGLSEYSYYGTRLLPFILLAFVAYLLLFHWRRARQYLAQFGLMALGYLVGFGPLLAYFFGHPGLYFGRGQGVLTWNHIPASWADLQLMWNTLWPLFATNLLTVSTIRANDTVYWAPLLLPFEAALLALGFAILCVRWRHPAAFLILLAGLGALFVGGTLVPVTSMLAHWAPAFSAFYVALAVPIGALAAASQALPARLRGAMPALLAVVLAALGLVNLDFYFNRYYAPYDALRAMYAVRTVESRYQASLGPGYRVYTIGQSGLEYDPETNQYLVKGQEGDRFEDPGNRLPVTGEDNKGLAFFFLQGTEQYRDLVHGLYPGGTERKVSSVDGSTLYFYVYTLKPEQAWALYGVHLDLYVSKGSAPLWSGQTPAVGSLPAAANFPTDSQLQATWTGSLYVPDTGTYSFELAGAPASLSFDGQSAALTGDQALDKGWHSFTIQAVGDPRNLRLRLAAQGNPASDVPTPYLWPKMIGKHNKGSPVLTNPHAPAGAGTGSRHPAPNLSPALS
jgi:4-amino-4-deoxy-L-arabinose transferase-like glycosyltransferase